MSNVLLINPIIWKWAAPNCVPSGLLHLRSVLRKERSSSVYLGLGRTYDLTGMGGIIAHEGFRRLT